MRPWARALLAIAVLRAGLGALILVVLSLELPRAAAISLVALALAQFTDNMDGWIARRYSTPSVAGYLEDSISDKLLHAGCLLGIGTQFALVHALLWLILVREFILLAMRVLTTEIEKSLARFKGHSVSYAVLLRLGIMVLLLASILPELEVYLVGAGHILVALAALQGLIGVLVVVRSMDRNGRLQ